MILNTPDPVLVALIAKLPAVEEGFTTGDRERWIAVMDAALQFLYPPEWSQEARRRGREARTGAGVIIAGVSAPDVAEALRAAKAKREAADHFPAITAPPDGVILAGPVSEPVLVVPEPTNPTPADARRPRRARCGICRFSVKRDDEWLPGEKVDTLRMEIGGQVEYAHLACLEKIGGPPQSRTEEAPSTTTADAVDDASGGGGTPSGAAPAPATSSPPDSEPVEPSPTSPSPSAPTTPSSDDPAPVPPPEPGRKRHFTADQKGAILRRVVREGMPAVQADLLIHESTLNRWVREMPKAVEKFTEEWEAEQQAKALAEGGPTVAELEAEQERPVPPRPDPPAKSKPVVQWPTAPIEHRPIIDHEAVRRRSAEGV